MAILVGRDSRVVVQGITGSAGSFHAEQCLAYGTKIVAGVTPGKGATVWGEGRGEGGRGVPVFDTVRQAVERAGADTSLLFVPAPAAADAILEAAWAGIRVIVCITEGIPVLDMARVAQALRDPRFPEAARPVLIGPNCPGILTPEECKVGIMPGYIHKRGPVGVVSRSGTLTYEAVWQLTQQGLGQSTVLGIGGDPIPGTNFVDILARFQDDPETKAVLLIGEIGGRAEEEAARFHRENGTKPLFAFVAGKTAPPGRRMGHAGAIIEGGAGTYSSKVRALSEAGIRVIENLSEIGSAVSSGLTAAASSASGRMP